MTNEEIQKAIARTWLPLNWGDKLLVLMYSGIALYTIGINARFIFYLGGTYSSLGFLLAVPLCLYVIYRIIDNKTLIPYSSELPAFKKAGVLDKLSKDPDVKSIKSDDNSYTLSVEDKWSNEPFTVFILFNESYYAVNSLKGSGRSQRLSLEKGNEIVAKIKAIESELKT